MKTRAFQRHKYSGEFYKFSTELIGDVKKAKYYFVGNIAVSFGINQNMQSVIRCDEPLPIGCLVANIKDADNNLILDDMIWQISSLQPVVNAFGNVEGYTMKAVKYQGTV